MNEKEIGRPMPPLRTYDRSWSEIEEMLDDARELQHEWRIKFDRNLQIGNKQGQKDAARNYKALEGVVKTLRWVLGENGVRDPLE